MKTIFTCIVGFAALMTLLAISAYAQDNDSCLECHEIGSSKSRLHISGSEFTASVHGNELSCLDCHPAAKDDLHTERTGVTPVKCLECHSEVKSVHARDKAKAPVCYDCHGKHGILPHTDPRSTLSRSRIDGTCGKCHPVQARQVIALPWILSFRVKGHGKAYLGDEYSRTWCLDCHPVQAAHGEEEPLTDKDCYRCHRPDAPGSVFVGSFHGSIGSPGKSPWNTFGDALYLVSLAVVLGLITLGATGHVRIWLRGQPERRWDRPLVRLGGWLGIVFRQKKLFTRRLAGWSHYLIFFGVMLPLLVIIVTQLGFTIPVLPSAALSILLDIAGMGLIAGVGLALYRRSRHRDEFPHDGKSDLVVLLVLALIALTGFLVEGLRISTTGSYSWISPFGSVLGLVLPASGSAAAWVWRTHLLLVLVLLALISFSRLRHIVSASLSVCFRNLKPKGQLPALDVNQGDRFGISSAFDLTWKGLLDTDACLSCGRCREVCPAHMAEKPLSPMKVVRDIKKQALTCYRDKSRHRQKTSPALNHWISPEEIWACTTCQACQEACPVLVEHVDKVVGLRRGLVLNEGQVPKEAAKVLRNLQIFGDPEGYGAAHRRDWIPSGYRLDLNPRGNVVFWVGCRGAAHPRAGEVARALMSLAERAGENIRLLAEGERCCGDPARRLGAEDIFQDLAHRNIEFLRDLGAGAIVAFCPHCFNTLANEYPDFGGNFTVLSSIEWAVSLLESKRLDVRRGWPRTVTYHDPCYLGRINGQIEAPRSLLRAIPGLELMEPKQSGMDTFCCGAGGGRSWLHESGLRINRLRTEQCVDTGADHIATACPYCLVMLEDGLTGLGTEERVPARVFDVIEILEWVTR